METIINGHIWSLKDKYEKHEHWIADFFCSDGDGISLYIEKDKTGFELSCFSGIGSSKIVIDSVDFGVFQYPPNKVENFDFADPFNIKCVRIADFLCSKFCDYIPQK